MNIEKFIRELAMSFEDVTEEPHFEKTSFRYKKKIFATLDLKTELLCLKLDPINQDVFSLFDNTIIYPVPNKWGLQGWTNVEINKVKKSVLTDALKTAYEGVRNIKK